METISCNLCGSSETVQVYQNLPDYYLNTPCVHVTLVRCSNCGLIYQNPRPTPEEIGKYYEGDYPPFAAQSFTRKSGWLREKALQYGQKKRIRYVTHVKQGGKLLDIGCATGAFLKSLKASRSFDPHGVEINPLAAELARTLGLDVRTGSLKEAAYSDNFFDVVTMWDVLEHLHDPTANLREIWRVLKPGGALIIRVPNGGSLDARLFSQTWAGLDPPRHLYVFTYTTLVNILENTGFSVADVRYNSDGYPSFLLSLRFSLQVSAAQTVWKERLLRILYHPISQIVSAPFFYLLGLSKYGQTVVITAQKH